MLRQNRKFNISKESILVLLTFYHQICFNILHFSLKIFEMIMNAGKLPLFFSSWGMAIQLHFDKCCMRLIHNPRWLSHHTRVSRSFVSVFQFWCHFTLFRRMAKRTDLSISNDSFPVSWVLFTFRWMVNWDSTKCIF